jgi:hypothetical protein
VNFKILKARLLQVALLCGLFSCYSGTAYAGLITQAVNLNGTNINNNINFLGFNSDLGLLEKVWFEFDYELTTEATIGFTCILDFDECIANQSFRSSEQGTTPKFNIRNQLSKSIVKDTDIYILSGDGIYEKSNLINYLDTNVTVLNSYYVNWHHKGYSGEAEGFSSVRVLDSSFYRLTLNYEYEERVAVPEPSTLAIFALGMIGLASRRFKKQS